MSTWQHGSSPEDSGHHHAESVVLFESLREIDPASDSWENQLSAITSGLVDLLLQADVSRLANATDPLRDALAAIFDDQAHAREARGWLLALLSVTRWGLQRMPSIDELEIARDGMVWRFLRTLEPGPPRSSSELRQRLETGAPQVSRAGRELLARGLVIQRRMGREAMWELTPRGRQLLRDISQRGRAPSPTSANGAGRELHISLNGSAAGSGVHTTRRDAPKTRRQHSSANGGGHVRHVLPADGGWRVAKTPDARTIERTGTQREAVDRAREILKRTGGGTISVHTRKGDSIRSIDIDPR